MKLIFLYGPPGVGKLTVAKELSEQTGFKILHNHLTIDLVETVFEFGTEVFADLVGKLRLDLIEQAAKHKVKGLIFTMVYAYGTDDWYMRKIKSLVEKYGGKVYWVQLICSKKELLRRIKNPARRRFNKIKKTKTLLEAMKKHEMLKPVPLPNNITVENTKVNPKKTAVIIKNKFNL